MKPDDILNTARATLTQRAIDYDTPGGERSMEKTVALFNTLTDAGLTEQQGWLFMVCLKLARSTQGGYKEDNYVDAAAYVALLAESVSSESLPGTIGKMPENRIPESSEPIDNKNVSVVTNISVKDEATLADKITQHKTTIMEVINSQMRRDNKPQ